MNSRQTQKPSEAGKPASSLSQAEREEEKQGLPVGPAANTRAGHSENGSRTSEDRVTPLAHPASVPFRAETLRGLQQTQGNHNVQELLGSRGTGPQPHSNRIQRVTGLEATLPAWVLEATQAAGWVLGETIATAPAAGAAVGTGGVLAAIAAGALIGGGIGYGAWELEKKLLHSGSKTEEVSGILSGGLTGGLNDLIKEIQAGMLTESQQGQLQSGAIAPIQAGLQRLDAPDFNPEAWVGAFSITPFLDNFASQAPERLQPTVEAAANETNLGSFAVEALTLDKPSLLSNMQSKLETIAADIQTEVSEARSLATAAGSDPSMQADLPLTPAEAGSLETGAIAPIRTLKDLLSQPNPDLTTISMRIPGIAGMLMSVRFKGATGAKSNAKMQKQVHMLNKIAVGLDSLAGGEEAAKAGAKQHFQKALELLQQLVKSKDTAAGQPGPGGNTPRFRDR